MVLEHASGHFTIDGQVEDIFGGGAGVARLAHLNQTCLFTGDFEGESIADYSAVLPYENTGSFQGYQRFSGALGERTGSFVVRVEGEYLGQRMRGIWEIVPKTGSGDFAHIRGSGHFSQTRDKPGSYSLEFDLRKPRKSHKLDVQNNSDESSTNDVADDKIMSRPDPGSTPPNDEPVVVKPARRSRKTSKPGTIGHESTSEISEPASRRRRAQPKTPQPVIPESASIIEPKPDRYKKPVSPPPDPLALSDIHSLPNRRGKTKAA